MSIWGFCLLGKTGILGGLGGRGLVVGSEVIGGLVIGGLVVSGVGVGGLVVGSLVIGGLDKGGLGVAAGEENTPEPEESKDPPDSGVTSKGMSRVADGCPYGCSARIGNYDSLITHRTRCPNKPKPQK